MWFICLFFPCLIALYIHSKKFKINNYVEYLMLYGIYNVLVNLFGSFVCAFKSSQSWYALDKNIFTFSFSFKYLLITCLFSFIIIYILEFINNNFKLEVILRRKNNEKK